MYGVWSMEYGCTYVVTTNMSISFPYPNKFHSPEEYSNRDQTEMAGTFLNINFLLIGHLLGALIKNM